MKVYTVVKTDRSREAVILYCGENKDIANEVCYVDKRDEPSPDKYDAIKWTTLVAEFPE